MKTVKFGIIGCGLMGKEFADAVGAALLGGIGANVYENDKNAFEVIAE